LKTKSEGKRKGVLFNSTLRLHPTAYSNFVSLLHKLEIVSSSTGIFSRIRKKKWLFL